MGTGAPAFLGGPLHGGGPPGLPEWAPWQHGALSLCPPYSGLMQLADLGIVPGTEGVMLVAPTDAVLAEAGRMKPRPSIASTLQVAEPAAHIVWWPERRLLDTARLSRLRWMLEAGKGVAWLVWDPQDEELTAVDVRNAAASAGLTVTGERTVSAGEVALEFAPN
jgi:hypothetical protein